MNFPRIRLWLVLALLGGCYRPELAVPEEPRTGRKHQVIDVGGFDGTTLSDRQSQRQDASLEPEPTQAGGAAAGPEPHWIFADTLVNARDIGGTPVGPGRAVGYGALFRGPPLAALDAAGCAEFAALGIRTVIDLRIDAEREGTPEADCVNRNAHVVSAALPVPYNVSAQDYVADLDTTDSIASVFDLLGDEASYPVYLHCTWGRDRTGVLTAVILLALGASRADIMREYLLSGPLVGAYPRSLDAVFDTVERRGGIAAYLKVVGVSETELATLRRRVVVASE